MKKTNFKYVKIGTPVWTRRYGWGKIVDTNNPSILFPISVKFDGDAVKKTFTQCGCLYIEDKEPSLFFTEVYKDIKMNKLDFRNAEIGEEVCCVIMGKGEIACTNKRGSYPIEVSFLNNKKDSYTKEGLRHLNDPKPSLYYEEIPIPESATRPKLKKGQAVVVWDDDNFYQYIRVFSHFENNTIHTYDLMNSGTVSWENWEIFEEQHEKV